MSLQVSNMEDLFLRYLAELTKKYPYIQLETNEESTTISLGYEFCCDLEKGLSQQVFFPFEKYSVLLDFQRIQSAFQKHSIITINNKIMLLETKEKITAYTSEDYSEKVNLVDFTKNTFWPELFEGTFESSERLWNYLSSHKRVVLVISKVREFQDEFSNFLNDSIYIGKFNCTTAYVLLGCNPDYTAPGNRFPFYGFRMGGADAYYGETFITSFFQIEHLNPNEFDVFMLKDAINSATYEIINKNL